MENNNVDHHVSEGDTPGDESMDQQHCPPEPQQSVVPLESTTTNMDEPEGTTIDSEPSKAGTCSLKTCFGSTLTANFLVLPGTLLALLGLVWMILSQRWTTRNDKLQDCINLRVSCCQGNVIGLAAHEW